MKSVNQWPVGICSWSLHDELALMQRVRDELGLEHMHLATGPALTKGGVQFLDALLKQGWTVTSTMVGFPQEDYSTLETIRRTGGVAPDDEWPTNRRRFVAAATVTADLKVPFLSMHAGFIDHADAAYAQKFHDRIRCLADAAGERHVTLLMETGQECAAELRDFLVALAHPALGINFDPANMILYDKDEPSAAVRVLGPWVKHIHVKDAIRTTVPGQWGSEVPWGDGQVDGAAFLDALKSTGYKGALAIEREAGGQRLDDIQKAVERLTTAET